MRTKFFLTLGVAALASMSQATIVLDLISGAQADTDNIWLSQDFEAAEEGRTTNALEDFTVNSNQLVLDQVQVVMQGFNGFINDAGWANVTGFRVEVYTSLAAGSSNPSGNAGSAFRTPGQVTRTNLGWTTSADGHNPSASLITIPINIVLPSAGTYWIGVMGVLDAGANANQIGVANNTASNGGQNGTLVNPGGVWGFTNNQFNTQNDLQYRLNAVPEPGSMIALGLGAAALLARRRRKAA